MINVKIIRATTPYAMSNRFLHLYLGALLTGFVLAFMSIMQPGTKTLPASAAASVNGEIISNERYSQALTRFENDSREPVSAADAAWILDRLIDEELLLQRASELDLVTGSASVRSAILDALIAKITQGARANTLGNKELQDWYEKNAALFRPDPRYAIQVFRFQDQASARDANTPELAKEKGRTLNMPAGLLPVRKILDYAGAAVAAQIPDLPTNSLSSPFESNQRWSRVFMLEREEQNDMAFLGNEALIRAEWQRRQADQALRRYIENLRKEAKVLRSTAVDS